MSSTTTLERAARRLKSALDEDLKEASQSRSPLVQYRAIIAARKQIQQAEQELAQIEDGLATAATEEWEQVSGRLYPKPQQDPDEEPEDDINF